MGAVIFLILFVLGFLVATAGGIIGLVEAFRVNTVWGLLYLLVPFAALVFFIKFWNRRGARNGFLLWIGGLAVSLLSLPFLGGFINQRFAQWESEIEEVPIESIPTEEIPGAEAPETVIEEEIVVGEEEDLAEEGFAEPIVPAAPQLSAIASAELIQSTDPNERLQQINSSRSDPFATVPVPPPPQAAPPPAPGGGGAPPGAGGTPTGGVPTPGGGPAAVAPQPPTPGGGQATPTPAQPGGGGGTTTPSPGGPGAPGGATPPIEPLPALPQPTLAQGVQVSGVVRIGNENYAIVQSPTEGSSQYVKAGQRLANGQVLVKRIEVRGSNPVVILEENGIEVAQPVGAPDIEPEQGPAGNMAARFSGSSISS